VLLPCVVAVCCCSVLLQCVRPILWLLACGRTDVMKYVVAVIVTVCCCSVLLQCVVAVCCCSVFAPYRGYLLARVDNLVKCILAVYYYSVLLQCVVAVCLLYIAAICSRAATCLLALRISFFCHPICECAHVKNCTKSKVIFVNERAHDSRQKKHLFFKTQQRDTAKTTEIFFNHRSVCLFVVP